MTLCYLLWVVVGHICISVEHDRLNWPGGDFTAASVNETATRVSLSSSFEQLHSTAARHLCPITSADIGFYIDDSGFSLTIYRAGGGNLRQGRGFDRICQTTAVVESRLRKQLWPCCWEILRGHADRHRWTERMVNWFHTSHCIPREKMLSKSWSANLNVYESNRKTKLCFCTMSRYLNELVQRAC